MSNKIIQVMILSALLIFIVPTPGPSADKEAEVALPAPETKGAVSLEESLNMRRSIRRYKSSPVKLAHVSQILWAAGGLRVDAVGSASRTFPSAGGLYPLDFYLVAGNVTGLSAGVYRYLPKRHKLKITMGRDVRKALSSAALGQGSIKNAPFTIVITAAYKKTTWKYGKRGIRFVHMDTGHAGANIVLSASALGLGVVTIGAFNDDQVNKVLKLPKEETALYILPIGIRR